MDRLKGTFTMRMGVAITGLVLAIGSGWAQVPQSPGPQSAPGKAPAAAPTGQPAAAAPLKLYSLGSETQTDPFPPVNPKFFTADSPSLPTVEGYLKTMLGFDASRIWRVMAIQKTQAAGVSKVTVLVSERGAANAKVLSAVFYVLPDGKHLIAGDAQGVSPFGIAPFAANRAVLQARADGPAHGSAAKDLMLVEFADLQCPHCKDAQATMNKLVQDFPKARIVFENYPLIDIHPYAFQAAAYGDCIAKKNQDAFFAYAQAVYDTQGALLPDSAEQTLKNATTKAGMDEAEIATCAAGPAARAAVEAQMKLGDDLGVDQTPMISINGRMLGLASMSYETLKSLIVYQAGLDGVAAAAASPSGSGVDLKAH